MSEVRIKLTKEYIAAGRPDIVYVVKDADPESHIWQAVSEDHQYFCMPYSPTHSTPQCYLINQTTMKPAPFTIKGKPNLITAIAEELKELGYEISKVSGPSTGILQSNYPAAKNIANYKNLTHTTGSSGVIIFNLPKQYAEAVDYARSALASGHWNESKFKVGDYVVIPSWENRVGLIKNMDQCSGYTRFHWSELWLAGVDSSKKFPTMANGAWEKTLRVATSEEVKAAKTTPAPTFKEGDIVVITGNSAASCNSIGDIGRVGAIISDATKPYCEVHVTNSCQSGIMTYLNELRLATPEEIAIYKKTEPKSVRLSTGQVALVNRTVAVIEGRSIQINEVEKLLSTIMNLPQIRGYAVEIDEGARSYSFGCQGPYSVNDLRNVVNAAKSF